MGPTREKMQKAINDLKTIKLIRFLSELEQLSAMLEGLKTSGTSGVPAAADQLCRFAEVFEVYATHYRIPDALVMLEEAMGLRQALLALRESLQATDAALIYAGPLTEGEARVTLVLWSQLTFDEFVQKLAALLEVCSQLSIILQVSLREHPIRIVKIESGSLWADLLGYPKLVDLVVHLVEGTAGWMYRKFTNEGNISAIPREVAALESIVGLVPHLRAAGVDTEKLRETIEIASVRIAENLNVLLAGEPRIEVNGTVHSVSVTMEGRFLEEARRRPLLAQGGGTNEGNLGA